MLYHLDVEDMEPNHWIAYVFELPGCFSSARTYDEATAHAPARIAEHFDWLLHHGSTTRLATEPIEVEVSEVFQSFKSEGDYIVNAFFAHDREPLSDYDVRGGLSLLESTRRDLLELLEPLTDEQLRAPRHDDQSIEAILAHIAWAEWWYVDRLNLAFPRDEMPLNPIVALRHVREQFVDALPTLIGDERIMTRVGEQWSARKVLRRALWHERDHTQHLTRLLSL